MAGSAASNAVAMKTSDAAAQGMVVRLAVENNDMYGMDFHQNESVFLSWYGLSPQ